MPRFFYSCIHGDPIMTRPNVKEVVDIINRIAPFALAEKWDNSGLQAGHPHWKVSKILVALDVTAGAMDAAAAGGCSMVVAHHPLTMSPEKSMDFSTVTGSVVYTAATCKIAVVSAHTNLDKARDGLNDFFARKIGIQCRAPLLPDDASTEGEICGIGRTGVLEAAMDLGTFAREIKSRLDTPFVRVVGDPSAKITTAALCTGSGGSLIGAFLNSDTDVYITGDLKYHEARDIEAAGKSCIDVGHFPSEHIVVDMLTRRLETELKLQGCEVEILGYKSEKDPFRII